MSQNPTISTLRVDYEYTFVGVEYLDLSLRNLHSANLK